MNKNSYICNYINEHPDTWRKDLEEKNIKIKDDYNLSIFNYDIMADFSDPIVQEARGIIIDTVTLEVVCWPFRKFFNSHEVYADRIDWSTAEVQEKIDGSIVKFWYDSKWKLWRISSNSCISAAEALLSTGVSIAILVKRTPEYEALTYIDLNEDCTYIFELVGPMNQVVIKYEREKLYHIGTRNNLTGREYPTGELLPYIESPKTYPLHSLEDCIKASEVLNKSDYPDKEGFVVVDKEWNRIKVKAPEYLIYHHAVNNGIITKERAYELLNLDDFNMEEFMKTAPEHIQKAIRYYAVCFTTTKEAIKEIIKNVRRMSQSGMSRKEIALALKGNRYSHYGFLGLDKAELSAEEIVNIEGKKYIKLVEDFKEE